MKISASMVKELRERTGAGMMECKKALVENEGDMDTAAEYLRKQGIAKADKKAGRVAAEGTIALARDGNRAALVEVNCETDFVGGGDDFKAFAAGVANASLAQGGDDLAALMATNLDDGSGIEETRRALIARIGENIGVRRHANVSAPSALGAYLHGTRIGVLVALEGGDETLATDIAMHIAAMKPQYVSADEVPADVLAKEKEILTAQAAGSGKPENIIEKMVEGRIRKYLAEITLVGQAFVKDGDITVEKLLAKAGAKVTHMVRMEVGEGIEKKQEDFAAEVMSQVKGD